MLLIDYQKLPILQSDELILRPIDINDTEKIVTWRNNPSVMANFVYRSMFTKAIHENWMKTNVFTGRVIQYIIIEKCSDLPLGSIYYRDIKPDHSCAEYGIFIGEESKRGKGYGKKASQMFIDFGLNTLGLHKIFLRVFSENYRAINMYTSIGFQLEGIARDLVYIDNQYKTMLFMAVTL